MGNSSSKKKTKKGGKGSGGDDGCIGNRRVRTIILSILMVVFFVFATPYAQGSEELYRDISETTNDVPLIGGITGLIGDGLCIALNVGYSAEATCEDYANSYATIMAGCILSIVGAIAAVLLFIIPNCDDKLGRVAGFILIVGGVVYLAGWIWLIALIAPDSDTYDNMLDGTKSNVRGRLTGMFGEALLAGGSALLLGLDAAFQIYENEAYRLSSNLGIICTVSALCIGGYYSQVCTDEFDAIDNPDGTCLGSPDGVEMIATGYLILFWVCLIYIILYILTCCTCDCKDKCLVRLIIAITLVVGGVLTAIGYYVYVGAEDVDYDQADDDGAASIPTKRVVYFVGYSILIGGLAVVWALDMAFDDVKNR